MGWYQLQLAGIASDISRPLKHILRARIILLSARPPSALDLPLHPASASWLNAVEGFFSALTRRRLQRGTFTGIVDLQAAIKRYIGERNRTPRPFVWTKPATAIFDALNRAPESSV